MEVLRDLGSDESPFGVVLYALLTHPDLAATIAATEGLVDLCAWVGTAWLLVAYAWVDSVPNERCRSCAFGIMRVWQNIMHYREALTRHFYLISCLMPDTTDSEPPLTSTANDFLPWMYDGR